MTAGSESLRISRRAYVLETVAGILASAAEHGRRFVLAVDGSGCAGEFADDLAETLRHRGSPCARFGSGSEIVPGIVLADGERWRDQPPAGRWDVIVFLRTPTSHGLGDGERGADLVIDYHNRDWPVIRHVSSALEHPIERLYVTETQAFFGARALTWNDKFGDDLASYESAVIESDVSPGATIVDVGCGTGRALPALRSVAGDGGTVIGVDVTPEMLTVAALQYGSEHHLVMADARHLPLATASADVIFAAGLIQHLPDPAAGLAELARITRPGGKMIIFHPSGRAALAARHGRTVQPDEPLSHRRLQHLLQTAGWTLTRYDDSPHRFYALAHRA
jgi:methyltransferase family protein